MSGDTTTVDSEMSTSVNSDASLDIDIVRHHDGMETFRQTVCNPTFPVATSTANLLDTRYSDTETESEDDLSQFGRSKIVIQYCVIVIVSNIWKYFFQSNGVGGGGVEARQGPGDEGLHAWLGVSWLIMYLMFVLFLLYKRKPTVQPVVR